MSLLSNGFLGLVAVLALLISAGAWRFWNRWSGWHGALSRAVSLFLVLVMGAVSAAAYTNHVFGFYASVDDLLGSIPAQRYQPPSSFASSGGRATVTVETPSWQSLVVQNAKAGHGTLLTAVLPGPLSHITRRALLYLPAAYSRDDRSVAFPVIEMFNGYPGKPSNFPRLLALGPTIDAEVAAGRMPPAIVVIPTVYEHRSSECVNAVNNGERDETYLAVDVPADLAAAFRVAAGRSFGALGYSEGGFCAANLGLHHPDRYSAVVSLSGYFTAGVAAKTIPYLYGKQKTAINRNSPLWWVRHRNPTGPPLWLMSSSGDPSAVKDATRLRNAARRYAPRLTVVTPVVEGGGHNFNTWLRAFPPALDFLGANLPAPLAPPLTLPSLPR